jgi:hypothetical protein
LIVVAIKSIAHTLHRTCPPEASAAPFLVASASDILVEPIRKLSPRYFVPQWISRAETLKGIRGFLMEPVMKVLRQRTP